MVLGIPLFLIVKYIGEVLVADALMENISLRVFFVDG
jgi:hypothetical protein